MTKLRDFAQNLMLLVGIVFFGVTAFERTLDHDFGPRLASVAEAEAKVVDAFRDHLRDVSDTKVEPLAKLLTELCRRYDFDPAFILSLIDAESRFRAAVVSPAGAIGLMQIMPGTGKAIAERLQISYEGKESLANPFINLRIGIEYLAELRARYDGLSEYHLLAAYNLGPGRFDKLRSQKDFQPSATLRYYEKIRDAVPSWRNYRALAERSEAQG